MNYNDPNWTGRTPRVSRSAAPFAEEPRPWWDDDTVVGIGLALTAAALVVMFFAGML